MFNGVLIYLVSWYHREHKEKKVVHLNKLSLEWKEEMRNIIMPIMQGKNNDSNISSMKS